MALQRNDRVRYWFDDGRGGGWLYGTVEAAGPKLVTIRWESGIVQRLRQSHHLIELVKEKHG